MSVRSEYGKIDLSRVFLGFAVLMCLGVLWLGIDILCNPKCHFAVVTGENAVGKYEFRKMCKTQVEAASRIPELVALLPAGSSVTYVGIHDEGRSWFCK